MVTVRPTRIALGTAIGLVLLPVTWSGADVLRASSAPADAAEDRETGAAPSSFQGADASTPVTSVKPTRIAASGKKNPGGGHSAKPAEAQTATTQTTTSGVPPAPVLLALLRGTLVSVNQANITGNYSVLRDLGSPNFRERYTTAELAEQFRPWRAQTLDFAAVLLLDAKLVHPPEIEPSGALHLVGFFPTSPLRIGFDLRFEPVGGHWRLATLALDARSASGETLAPSSRAAQAATPGASAQAPTPSGPTPAAGPATTPVLAPGPVAIRPTSAGAALIVPLPGPAASAAAAEQAAARQAESAAASRATAPPPLPDIDAPPLRIGRAPAATESPAPQAAAGAPQTSPGGTLPAPFQMRRETDLPAAAPATP